MPVYGSVNKDSAFFQRKTQTETEKIEGERRGREKGGKEGGECKKRRWEDLYFLLSVHCLHGHPRLFVKNTTLLFHFYAKTPWPRKFIDEFIWACSPRRIKVYGGRAEAWRLQQEADGSHLPSRKRGEFEMVDSLNSQGTPPVMHFLQ